MVRPTLTDLNTVELKYYPFMGSLGKCSGSCNSGKDINNKVFNVISKRNEAKTLVKHVSCDCKLNSIVKLAIQIKNG